MTWLTIHKFLWIFDWIMFLFIFVFYFILLLYYSICISVENFNSFLRGMGVTRFEVPRYDIKNGIIRPCGIEKRVK